EGSLLSASRRFSRARTRCDGLQYNCGLPRWLTSKRCPQCLHLRVGVAIFVTNCVTRNYIRNAIIFDDRILNHLGARLSLGGGPHQVVSYYHWPDPSTFPEYLNEIFP